MTVFVASRTETDVAIGFYALSFAAEDSSSLTLRQDRDNYKLKGVPLVFLHYLAVNKNCQNSGVGKFLLIDCLRRAHFVAKHVAFYGVGLRSLNQKTTDLYRQFGFEIAGQDSATPLMILPIWTINDMVAGK